MANLEEHLRCLGLINDTSPDAPICRWLCDGIKVDVMPVAEKVFGFSNRWYAEGMRHLTVVRLPSGLAVRVFASPYFLASKIEAYEDRGKSDPFMSKDLEDIIAVLDGRSSIIDELRNAPIELQTSAALWARTILAAGEHLEDALRGHLPYGGSNEQRLRRLQARLSSIAMLAV